MYISVFRSSNKYFLYMRTKAFASDSRTKKTVCNGIIMAASEQQRDVFREVFLDLVGINFGNCGISIDP